VRIDGRAKDELHGAKGSDRRFAAAHVRKSLLVKLGDIVNNSRRGAMKWRLACGLIGLGLVSIIGIHEIRVLNPVTEGGPNIGAGFFALAGGALIVAGLAMLLYSHQMTHP
jgi:hypothetical protein